MFLLIFSMLTVSLAANAKSLGCDIGVYRIEKDSSRSLEWPINDLTGYSHTSLDLDGTPLRVITNFRNLPQGQLDSNMLEFSVSLDSLDSPPKPLISLKDFYFLSSYPSNKNDYISMNHPRSGSLALTPIFISAIKKLGKWGEKPFDAVSIDHTIASPDVNVSNSVDFDYFQANGGLDVANDALSKGLINKQDPLFIWVDNTCSTVK